MYIFVNMKVQPISAVLLIVTIALLVYGATSGRCTRLPYGGSLNCNN